MSSALAGLLMGRACAVLLSSAHLQRVICSAPLAAPSAR